MPLYLTIVYFVYLIIYVLKVGRGLVTFWCKCYLFYNVPTINKIFLLLPLLHRKAIKFNHSLTHSWGLTGGTHYQKITIPIFKLVQNFVIPGYFPYILFYRYPFSLLSSGWYVIAVCGSIPVRELVKYLESL